MCPLTYKMGLCDSGWKWKTLLSANDPVNYTCLIFRHLSKRQTDPFSVEWPLLAATAVMFNLELPLLGQLGSKWNLYLLSIYQEKMVFLLLFHKFLVSRLKNKCTQSLARRWAASQVHLSKIPSCFWVGRSYTRHWGFRPDLMPLIPMGGLSSGFRRLWISISAAGEALAAVTKTVMWLRV